MLWTPMLAGIVSASSPAAPTQQPPTFDAVATYTSTTSSIDPHTLTNVITVGTGNNRRLLVWVCDDDTRSISAVRLTNSGGTLFTLLGTEAVSGGGRGRWAELLDPPTGVTTLWIDLAAAGRIGVVIYSLRDCDNAAATVAGTPIQAGASTTSVAPTVTPGVASAMVLSGVMESSGTSQGNTAIGALNGQTDTALIELGTPANSTATAKGGRSVGPDPAALVTHGWSFNLGGGVSAAIATAIAVPGLAA